MALVTSGTEFMWPRPSFPHGSAGMSNINVWASQLKLALICRAPKSGTLDKAEWQMPGGGATMRVSFQALTGSAPSGTQAQYRDLVTATGWNTPGLVTSDGTDSGTKRTVTRGDWFAIVWEFPGTVGDIYFSRYYDGSNFWAAQTAEAYVLSYVSGAWSATAYQTDGLDVTLKYSDGSYARFYGHVVPIVSDATEAFGSGSTPDERGLYLTTLVPLRVSGAWALLDQDAAFDLVLYDTNGTTVLASASLGATPRGTTTIATAQVRFSSDLDLPIGTGYRLVVKPTSASTVGLYVLTLNASGHREAHPGGLQTQYTSRTDAGAWTQTPTKLPQLGLLVSGLDDGTSGGAVAVEHAHTFVGVLA